MRQGLRTQEGSTLKPGREAGSKRRERTGRLSTDLSWVFGWQGLKTPFIWLVSPDMQAGVKGGGKPGGSPEAPGGGRGEGDSEDGVATCRPCHRQVNN